MAGGRLEIRNKYSFIDLSHLTFHWRLQVADETVDDGQLHVPYTDAGHAATIDLPSPAHRAQEHERQEVWLTVTARLEQSAWADRNHEVAFAQLQLRSRVPVLAEIGESVEPVLGDRSVHLGPAVFDRDSGKLLSLGRNSIASAQIDLWRAPTDNDKGGAMNSEWPEIRTSNYEKWLDAGLDRVQHQVNSVALDGNQLVVSSQVGPAVLDRYMEVTTRYTATAQQKLTIEIEILPKGPWKGLELPRLGYQLQLDNHDYHSVRWHGLGPDEAYPDTRSGVRLGVYESTIDEWQTPYVTPQENGNRLDVRYAHITNHDGKGIRVTGHPSFDLSVRRWSTESLAGATRQTQLTATDRLYVSLDHLVSGVGSASTGPGVLDPYVVGLIEDQAVCFAFELEIVE